MKKIVFLTLTAVSLLFLIPSEMYAQRHDRGGDKHDKHRKESSRKRKDYDRDHRDYKHWKNDHRSHRGYAKVKHKHHKRPAWAAAHRYEANRHIYFRDYGTFYDPYREVYVYRNRGRWVQTTSVPTFMLNVNLGRAQVTILKDIPVTRHPEDFYGDYNDRYWR